MKHINDEVIKQVDDIKFPGIYIDAKSNWNVQLNNVCRKVSSALGILFHVQDILDDNALRLLYCTLIYPHLRLRL